MYRKYFITLFIVLMFGAFPGRSVSQSEFPDMKSLIERFSVDRGSLRRTYPLPLSSVRYNRFKAFYRQWLLALGEVNFGSLDRESRVDYTLLVNYLEGALEDLEVDKERNEEMLPLLPFAAEITDLEVERRALEPVDAPAVATVLDRLVDEIRQVRESVEAGLSPDEGETRAEVLEPSRMVANRAASAVDRLREDLQRWYEFYAGYDPVFTWWVRAPYRSLDRSLEGYARFLRERVVGVKEGDKNAIVGDPIGRDALLKAIRREMISYTPEELIQIAEKEYAWCEEEMIKASQELGYGDKWLEALEHVKTLHVEPGDQPQLIKELAQEAVEFLEERDLVSVPPLANETWRMEMMSADRQKISPFFLGGEVIRVAFPVDSMQHEQKMMSMRGNNIHFSRAVVHHELIPGHHLQGFMQDRYKTHRGLFWTPFWVEGWALYWEMVLWDMDFPRSAEDRIGMLFWRMHRCARIIFSLNFHLGEMTAEECIELLVDKVGHERDNATAEVRRSFGGDYPPLYQVAYMIGGLQFRALNREFVESGRMSAREFHDRILRENLMSVEMVRALLREELLEPNHSAGWKFYPGLD